MYYYSWLHLATCFGRYQAIIRPTRNSVVNPLNAELNPICHLLALLEAHHILLLKFFTFQTLSTVKCLTL